MNDCKHRCNIHTLNSFSKRIQHLVDTLHSKSTSGISLIRCIGTLLAVRFLSKIVIRDFSKDWQKASCDIHADENCANVLKKAVTVKDQLVAAHVKLITLPSPVARWAGKRLISPVLDWNDLVLDLSIASDPHIQESLSELEELL